MSQLARAKAQERPKVLVFCRAFLVHDFRENVRDLHGEFEFDFLTEGKSAGTRDTRDMFYAALRSEKRSPDLTESDLDEVITRCRLLRNIDPEQAQRLTHAMAITLADELAVSAPQVILSPWVDEYVTHLLSLLAAKRNIVYLGYAYSYFPGRAQLMQFAYGEPFMVRNPSAEEVAAVYNEVSARTYRQNYLQPPRYSITQHIKLLIRHHSKRIVFRAKAFLERDPWNVHYASTPYIVDRRRLSDYPNKSDFGKNWRSRLEAEKAMRPEAPVVYLPLAYFPECAIDYWVEDRRILDYENVMLNAIQHLRRHAIVVVKEHLHMIGARNRSLYAALNAMTDVVSVHPSEYSNDVLEASDVVLLGAGSVGLEATIRQKPIVSYCHSSFWFDASGATALDLGDVSNWHLTIASAIANHKPMNERQKHDFIRTCLQSTVKQRAQGKRWILIETEDVRRMLNAALELGDLN